MPVAKSSPSNVIEDIGLINDTTKQTPTSTHAHRDVNVQITKDEHQSAMGGTEPENHINNPAQTENSSTDRPNVSH
jgi:hypothetical protein